MTEEKTNLALEHLRHIRGVVGDTRAEMKHFIMRRGLVERNVVSLHVADASQNVEIDRLKERLDRLERRLDLAEG